MYLIMIMARPPELKYRIPKTINFEYQDIMEFEKLVGKDNVSREIRAFIKKFVEEEKKGEASLDPLNLARQQYHAFLESTDGINSTLDIYLLSKKDIVEYIDRIEDIKILAQIQDKAHVFETVAKTKKLELLPLERFRNDNR